MFRNIPTQSISEEPDAPLLEDVSPGDRLCELLVYPPQTFEGECGCTGAI